MKASAASEIAAVGAGFRVLEEVRARGAVGGDPDEGLVEAPLERREVLAVDRRNDRHVAVEQLDVGHQRPRPEAPIESRSGRSHLCRG